MRLIFKIIAILFIFSSCQEISKSTLVAPVKYEGKFGYINTTGNWVIQPAFDSVGIFRNGFATFYKGEKEGKINYHGKVIIQPKYDFIGGFEDSLALVLDNDSINYVSPDGELICKDWIYDGEDYSEGLAAVQIEKDGKWGYINRKCELSIRIRFDLVYEFKDEQALVEVGDHELIINTDGKVIDTVESQYSIKKFDIIGSANTNTQGRINNNGDTIMDMKYRSFGYPQDNLFWFFDGNKYGIADTNGLILIPPKFEDLTYFADNDLALAQLNDLYGYIDKEGQVKIDFQFQEAKGFKYNLAPVMIDGKWGFINSDGEVVIEPLYDNATHQFRPMDALFEPIYEYDNPYFDQFR